MTDSICPNCKAFAYLDPRTSTSYCKTSFCNNIVIEFGTINNQDDCKLGDPDQPGNKQSRFGGFENKIEAYKNSICEMLGISDSKQRKKFNIRMEAGEHRIHTLNKIFNMNEAFTNDALYKYRSLIRYLQSEIPRKITFYAIAVYAYYLTMQGRKSYDQRLSKITLELIAKYSKIPPQQIHQAIRDLNNNTNGFAFKLEDLGQQDICQQIALKVQKHNLPFNDDEILAIKDIPSRLMDNSIIRGEKTSTIACVVEYMVSQLSSNSELNKLTIDQLAQMNDVSKDTVKKLWNKIIDNQSSQNHISRWQGQRSISELKHIY
ncbi:unnamed protein product [Paramecium octaurelia]|uniref:Uncharacterized protein n=1 Tax=Paramecium octaurelia TaxID=43137 RepID=A0A8S1X4U9_PAROT|nr:unnamed protein product [Paramecium octaurelia]